MQLVRTFLLVSRKVNQLKNEFPHLYRDFQEARQKKDYSANAWIRVSDKGYEEYVNMVQKYFTIKPPNNSREVWVTTADGGKYVGFYEDGKWWYNSIAKRCEITAQIIRWERY